MCIDERTLQVLLFRVVCSSYSHEILTRLYANCKMKFFSALFVATLFTLLELGASSGENYTVHINYKCIIKWSYDAVMFVSRATVGCFDRKVQT